MKIYEFTEDEINLLIEALWSEIDAIKRDLASGTNPMEDEVKGELVRLKRLMSKLAGYE